MDQKVGVEVIAGIMVRRNFLELAAFFVEPDPGAPTDPGDRPHFPVPRPTLSGYVAGDPLKQSGISGLRAAVISGAVRRAGVDEGKRTIRAGGQPVGRHDHPVDWWAKTDRALHVIEKAGSAQEFERGLAARDRDRLGDAGRRNHLRLGLRDIGRRVPARHGEATP